MTPYTRKCLGTRNIAKLRAFEHRLCLRTKALRTAIAVMQNNASSFETMGNPYNSKNNFRWADELLRESGTVQFERYRRLT